MPTYVYEFENGERIEVFQSMKDDPLAEIDGRAVTKCVIAPQLAAVALSRWDKYPYVSNALPTTIQGCKMARNKRKDGRLSRPKPLIESARHEREVMAKNDLVHGDHSDMPE